MIWMNLVTLIVIILFSVVIKSLHAGNFLMHQRINGNVINVFDKKGPTQCIKLCSSHKDCNGINYNMRDLICELLSVSLKDQMQAKQEYKYTLLASWSFDNNSCWPNPCGTNHHCVILHDKSHVCLPVVTPCIPNPCMGNETCVISGHNFICLLCPLGYHGINCDNYTCDSVTCYNGGTCIPTGSTTYQCNCTPGYSDPHCDLILNSCDSRKCTGNDPIYTCQCHNQCRQNKQCCNDKDIYCP